jgi:uncharacterized cupin superfamily protein
VPNIEDPDFQPREGAPPGFRAFRARLGYELGSERIGASVWKLPPGEAAYPYHFPIGEGGAHQIANPTDEEVRFLAVSTSGAPDIVVYPDSNKISASERLPEGGGLRTFFDIDAQVDYWKGESAPEQ